MATWKRLTSVENQKVDVNMDNIAYIEPQTDGGAWIHFVGGRISEGRTFALGVKEHQTQYDWPAAPSAAVLPSVHKGWPIAVNARITKDHTLGSYPVV